MDKELNEKLAIFMGCTLDLRACYKGREPQRGYELCDDPHCRAKEHFLVWQWPDGTHARFTPAFLDSYGGLSRCFEWLEPPLYERFGIYHIGFARVEGVGYNCFMNRRAIEEGRSKESTTLGHGESLEAAFCDATLNVIKKYPEVKHELRAET